MLNSERFRRLSKEGLWVFLGQIVAVFGLLVGVRLLTELLDPVAYGELALGLTLATLVNQTILGPLGNGVTRFYSPAAEQGDLGGYWNAVRILIWSATAIVLLMIFLTVIGLLLAELSAWIAIATAALFFAILSGYSSILLGIQNAARQRSIVALHQGMEPWARLIIAASLMVWLGATSAIALAGYSLAIILLLGSQYAFFRRLIPRSINVEDRGRSWQKQILTYTWPFASWGVFSWAQQASDRWALEVFATTQEVGLYAVLFQLSYYPMSMATGMAMQFFAPIFYLRAGDAKDNRRNAEVNNLSWRLTGLSLCVTGVVFLASVLLHTKIFSVLVAKEYGVVSHLLPWVILASGVFAAGQTMALNLMSQMKARRMIAAKIVTALLGVTFNVVGAYWYGTTGIVLAGVLFSLLYFLLMAALSKMPVREPKRLSDKGA